MTIPARLAPPGGPPGAHPHHGPTPPSWPAQLVARTRGPLANLRHAESPSRPPPAAEVLEPALRLPRPGTIASSAPRWRSRWREDGVLAAVGLVVSFSALLAPSPDQALGTKPGAPPLAGLEYVDLASRGVPEEAARGWCPEFRLETATPSHQAAVSKRREEAGPRPVSGHHDGMAPRPGGWLATTAAGGDSTGSGPADLPPGHPLLAAREGRRGRPRPAEDRLGEASAGGEGGPVTELQMELDRQRVVVGDPKPVSVTVKALDATGHAVDADVRIGSEAGGMGETRRLAIGLYRAELTVPTELAGGEGIVVLARAGGASARATLQLLPGPPASLYVDLPDSLHADGSTFEMSVTETDEYGNPADEPPTGEAQHGQVGRARRVGPGHFRLSYRPSRLSRDSEDLVRLRAGEATLARGVWLIAPVPVLSFAPKAGPAIWDDGQEARLAFGAELSLWANLQLAQLGLVAEGNYWRHTDGLGSQSYLPLTLSLAWRQPLGTWLVAWLSLGGGAARVTSTSGAVEQARWVPVATGAVSLGVHAWRGTPFVELRAMSMGDPGLTNLSGTLWPVFLVEAGYRFDLL